MYYLAADNQVPGLSADRLILRELGVRGLIQYENNNSCSKVH